MLRYELTSQDIAEGCRGAADNCPHSLAIQRRLRPNYKVSVFSLWVIISEKSKTSYYMNTPMPIADWVGIFDVTGKGEPGWFELGVPQEFLR